MKGFAIAKTRSRHLIKRSEYIRTFFASMLFLFLTGAIAPQVMGQVTIVSDGLNNSSALFTLSGGAYYTGSSASGDRPASSPFAVEGTHARGVSDATATLTSGNISTVGYTSIQLSFRLASFSIGSTTNGADVGDIVTVEISPDGGTTYYSTLRVLGKSNAYWSYSGGTGTASTNYDGNTTPVNFAPAGGGNRTTDGYSTVTISSLPSISNLRVRITLLNNDANERWLIDDVKITGTPTTCTAPSISVQPVSQTQCSGSSTTFSVTANCLVGSLAYQWKKNGINISGATASTYTIANTQSSDAGDYSVDVSCVCGSNPTTSSGTATLTVNASPADPTGTITPAANPACTSTTLSYSGASPAIFWQTSATGTNQTYPTTSPFTINTSGTYYVRAFDGSCWSNGALASTAVTINAPANITTQPSNQSVSIPATASFTVAATGTGLSYQWQVNTGSGWANVSTGSGGTLSTYTTEGTSSAMNGYLYQCVVSGATPCPAVTSSTAVLYANTGPCISEGFNSGTTPPSNWTFTNIGGTYTTAGNYGVSSPSLTLDNTNDRLQTSIVSGAEELRFWIKGQSTNAASALLVEGYNGTSWVTIDNITNSIPTTGTIKTYNAASTPALAPGFIQFRFTYTKSAGNLAFDDVVVTCATFPNTITTGAVSSAPYNVTCSTGASGTVAFTSTDSFTSNTYTAQLSGPTGSFVTPISIGNLTSNANSGTISVIIPAGTGSGTGYQIRVISSSPGVIGSSSAPFSITLAEGICSCFEIESILVDACDGADNKEGENEMFRFQVGPNPIDTADIEVDWPNNPWRTICQDATTAGIVSAINATITGGGMLVEPVNGVIPANAEVMFFTSTAFDHTLFDFSLLNYTLYVVFQCPGNTAGHFVNNSSNPIGTIRTLDVTISGCGSDQVSYDAYYLYNGDGATVDFDIPGNPTYSPSGNCTTVPIFPLPVSLIDFNATCEDNGITLHWSTASETNNDYFIIERSTNARDYQTIGTLPGAGNSNAPIHYAFADPEAAFENVYYRLTQVDYDGRSESFGPISSRCSPQNDDDFVLLSLTNSGYAQEISYQISSPDPVQVCVYDATGRRIRCDEHQGESGIRKLQLEIAEGSGLYLISLSNGTKMLSAKIFIP